MRSEEDIRYQIMQLESRIDYDDSIREVVLHILQWALGDHDADPRNNLDHFECVLDEIKDAALNRMRNLKESTKAILSGGNDVVEGLKGLLEEVKDLRTDL